jgi:hypothetical protein
MTISNPITHDEVVRIFGDIDDHKVVEILETGATYQDLEEAAAWIADEDDVMGELERSLSGTAARVYDIVTRGEPSKEEEAPRA